MELNERALFERVGEAGVTRIVAGFYTRVRADSLLGPMYPADDWEGAEKRLREFLLFRFGGDERYIRERGHPRLRMRHMPFAIGEAERDRWLSLMGEALAEAEMDPESRAMLSRFFEQVAEHMRNR